MAKVFLFSISLVRLIGNDSVIRPQSYEAQGTILWLIQAVKFPIRMIVEEKREQKSIFGTFCVGSLINE
jgi:hypothetical protein